MGVSPPTENRFGERNILFGTILSRYRAEIGIQLAKMTELWLRVTTQTDNAKFMISKNERRIFHGRYHTAILLESGRVVVRETKIYTNTLRHLACPMTFQWCYVLLTRMRGHTKDE